MPSNIEQIVRAGAEAQYARVDANLNAIGTAAALAPGEDSGSGLISRLKTADVDFPAGTTETATGDNEAFAIFVFPPDTQPSFNLDVAIADLAFAGAVQGTNVITTGKWDFGLVLPDDPAFTQMWLLLTAQAKAQDSGDVGAAGFYHLLLLTQMQYLGPSGGFVERSVGSHRYQCVADKFDQYPWGLGFTNLAEGALRAGAVEFFSDYKVAMHSFRDTGSGLVETFTLDHTPVGDEASDNYKIYKDGVLDSATDIDTTTNDVAITAGAASALWNIVYEYED